MGYFTDEKYKYWECEVKDTCADVKMKTEEEKETLDDIIKNVKKYADSKKEWKEKKKAAKNDKELSEINRELLTAESKYREEYAKGKREEEKQVYYNRYHQIKYQITRLKDIYSREEVIHIQVLNDCIEDGVVITSTSKIGEDIYKLEKYGISMSPLYFDELAKIIKDRYFDIKITERDYIDNEIPQNVIKVFVEFCRQQMGATLEDYLAKDGEHYDVKTTDLSAWYKESPFQRYLLRDIKEALIIYGYVGKPTKGRTDCTIGGQKVIRFYKDKLDKIKYEEDENE